MAPSRSAAQDLVASGLVLVCGSFADKPSRLVAAGDPVALSGPADRFVSRGGQKLDAALDHFELDVSGRRAIDFGASTGGFTDCLLQRGAMSVVAVDVGHGQLHPRLRSDARVAVHERTNVRAVVLESVGGVAFDVVVADLSFISLARMVPVLAGEVAATGADVVLLVKPQFEAGRADAARGRGVIRDPKIWRRALGDVASALETAGACIMGAMPSPLVGPAGNVEFLLHARAHTSDDQAPSPTGRPVTEVLDTVVAEAIARTADPGDTVAPGDTAGSPFTGPGHEPD